MIIYINITNIWNLKKNQNEKINKNKKNKKNKKKMLIKLSNGGKFKYEFYFVR